MCTQETTIVDHDCTKLLLIKIHTRFFTILNNDRLHHHPNSRQDSLSIVAYAPLYIWRHIVVVHPEKSELILIEFKQVVSARSMCVFDQ